MTRTGYSKRGSFPPLHRHTHNSELWQHVHYNNPNYPEWPGFLAVDGGSFVERGDDGQGALCSLGKSSTRGVVVVVEPSRGAMKNVQAPSSAICANM